MVVALPRLTAPVSAAPKSQALRRIVCRLALLLSLAPGLSGCHASSTAPAAASVVSARSLSATTPAIAWTNRTHYIALLALNGSSDKATATIFDPNKSAEETISQEQLLQRCGGYLLLVHR